MLGAPFGTDGPWLAAILDVLGDLHDLIAARLPAPVSEPDPTEAPPSVVPVKEPAPDVPAPPSAEPGGNEDGVRPPLPPAPPRAGRGSGLDAWQAFAAAAQVPYPEGASRADIITACEQAGVIPAE